MWEMLGILKNIENPENTEFQTDRLKNLQKVFDVVRIKLAKGYNRHSITIISAEENGYAKLGIK